MNCIVMVIIMASTKEDRELWIHGQLRLERHHAEDRGDQFLSEGGKRAFVNIKPRVQKNPRTTLSVSEFGGKAKLTDFTAGS
jgi:hypothetical protein